MTEKNWHTFYFDDSEHKKMLLGNIPMSLFGFIFIVLAISQLLNIKFNPTLNTDGFLLSIIYLILFGIGIAFLYHVFLHNFVERTPLLFTMAIIILLLFSEINKNYLIIISFNILLFEIIMFICLIIGLFFLLTTMKDKE